MRHRDVFSYSIGRRRISPRVNSGKLVGIPAKVYHERSQQPETDEDKNWMTEQLRTVETSLLTEFHKWALLIGGVRTSSIPAVRATDLEM